MTIASPPPSPPPLPANNTPTNTPIVEETAVSSEHTDKETRKVAHAVIWNYLSFGLGKGLVLISTAILARLLTTADFGLVAFTMLAISYLSVLKDLGLGAALIQTREDVEEAANTVFTLNLFIGIGLTIITYMIAPMAAAYFRSPEVTPLLRVLGFTFAINALGAIHSIRLQRELAFNRKLIPDLGRAIAKGVASVGFALAGYGVWSLIYGQLAGGITAVILSWLVYRWRPRIQIHRKLVRQLLLYGSTLLAVNILHTIIASADYLIVGRTLGASALGVYTLAYRLPELLIMNLLWVVSAAIFPAYSAIQNKPDLLRKGFLTTMRYIELISVPLCLGMFIVADPLIRVAFGPQWLDAIPIVRILSLFALVYSIGSNVGDVYKATGNPDILVKLGLISVGPQLFALWYGSRYGLVGIALGHLITSAVRTWLRLFVATRMIKVSWLDIARELRPSFLSGIVLLLCGVPVMFLTADMGPIVRLILITIAGAAGYLLALWFLEREELQNVIRLVIKR